MNVKDWVYKLAYDWNDQAPSALGGVPYVESVIPDDDQQVNRQEMHRRLADDFRRLGPRLGDRFNTHSPLHLAGPEVACALAATLLQDMPSKEVRIELGEVLAWSKTSLTKYIETRIEESNSLRQGIISGLEPEPLPADIHGIPIQGDVHIHIPDPESPHGFRHPQPKNDRLGLVRARLDNLTPIARTLLDQIKNPLLGESGRTAMSARIVLAEQLGEMLRTRASTDPNGVGIAEYWKAVTGDDRSGLLVGVTSAVRSGGIIPLESVAHKPQWLR